MAKHSSFKFLWVSKRRVLFTPAECVSANWDCKNQSRITLKSHCRHQTSMRVIYVPRRCFILCMRILWYYITCLLETRHSRIALLNRIFLLNSLNWLQQTERFVRNEPNQFEWFWSQPTHWTKSCLFMTCQFCSKQRTELTVWAF